MIPASGLILKGMPGEPDLSKPAPLIAILALLAGCQSKVDEVEKCEALLLPTLKAPSSYKLVDSTLGLPEKDGRRNVFLQYDAVNSYNAPLRATFWCEIDRSGNARAHDVEAVADDLDAMAANIAAADADLSTPNPFTETNLEETPVCDRPDSPEKFALMNQIGVDCEPD